MTFDLGYGTWTSPDGSVITVDQRGLHYSAPPVVQPPHPGSRRGVIWHNGWDGPPLHSWPDDVRGAADTVILAMAQSAGSGTGKLAMPPGVTRQEVSSIRAWRTGVDVLAGVGGSGDGGIEIVSEVQVTQAVLSALAMRDALGVTGICWDLEGSRWNRSAITDASQRLIASGMHVAIWSALYDGRLENWGAVAQALGDRLHHWERGFYDFAEAGDSRLTAIVAGDLVKMRRFLARDDQLVASFAPVATTSRTPVPVAVAAYSAARAGVYPGAGWSVWEDHQDSAQDWAMTRALAKV